MNAKRILAVAAISICCLAISACSRILWTSDPVEVSEPAVRQASIESSGLLLGLELPTTIGSLEASVGAPTLVQLPSSDDPSPWGQWVSWALPDGSTLSVVADAYDTTEVDREADVRLVVHTAVPNGDPSGTVDGLVLNGTTGDGVVSAVPTVRQTAVDSFGGLKGSSHDDVFVAKQGGLWTYYFMRDDLLVRTAQSSFPLEGAD